MKELEDLSLADLVALRLNYWLSKCNGYSYHTIITYEEFDAIEMEIKKRVSKINFNYNKETV